MPGLSAVPVGKKILMRYTLCHTDSYQLTLGAETWMQRSEGQPRAVPSLGVWPQFSVPVFVSRLPYLWLIRAFTLLFTLLSVSRPELSVLDSLGHNG